MTAGDELPEPGLFTSGVGDRSGVFVRVGVEASGPSLIMVVGAAPFTKKAVMVVDGSSRAANKCIAPLKRM